MTVANATTAPVRRTRSKSSGSVASLFAFVTVIFAAGFVSNESSYFFLPFLVLIAILTRRSRLTTARLNLILLTLLLCVYGAGLGVVRGHSMVYILKFFAPIFILALLLYCRNIGPLLFQRRTSIMVACCLLTLFFLYLIQSDASGAIALLMRGWTTNNETVSAISVWHYFALTFALVHIFEFTRVRTSEAGIVKLCIAGLTIISLMLLTNTSAFDLAAALGLLAILAQYVRLKTIMRIVLGIIAILMVDYFTAQFVTGAIADQLKILALSDEGNSIRLVQVNYFIANISLVGEGFGAAHAFESFADANRQAAQEAFPYSSELPILNVINGGGAIATLWFLLLVRPVFHCLSLIRARQNDIAVPAYFGFAAALVLVGSLSNPFFFSPISMLLLAVACDIANALRPRAGTTAPAQPQSNFSNVS